MENIEGGAKNINCIFFHPEKNLNDLLSFDSTTLKLPKECFLASVSGNEIPSLPLDKHQSFCFPSHSRVLACQGWIDLHADTIRKDSGILKYLSEHIK